jgi:hypothetical protein
MSQTFNLLNRHLIRDVGMIALDYLEPECPTLGEYAKTGYWEKAVTIEGDPNGGLWGACISGNLELSKLFINRGADDFKRAFTAACVGGHRATMELIRKICKHPSAPCLDYNYALTLACCYNQIHLVKAFIHYDAYMCECGNSDCVATPFILNRISNKRKLNRKRKKRRKLKRRRHFKN